MFEAEAVDKSGTTRKWQTWNSCTGGFKAKCPKTWNLGEASQPQLIYEPSVLPEGIDTLSVTAYDAVLRKSTTANGMTVRVDHAPPTVTLSGTLTEQATLGTERARYTIRADAKDGVPGSEKPQDVRSGVASIVIKNDGQVVGEYKPGCPTQSCSAYQELEVPASELTPGSHTLSVTATDALGHTSQPTQLNYTTGDKQAPALSTTGLPAESAAMPKHASYWSAFGSNGTGNGQLRTPADVAVDANGDLWVVDRGNNRVQKFNSKGEYLMKFGSTGSGNGQLNAPAALAIDSKGNIWVADKGNDRVEKFNSKGEYLAQFGSEGTGNGQFASGGPEGIAIDSKGNIWVSDTYAGRLQKFDENGNFLKVVGSEGSGPGQLREPTGIDIGPDGKVWVADWLCNRISVFNEAGGFVTQFGSAGTGNGQFNRPDAIAIGSRGDVWVGDQNNDRIQEFDQSGTYLGQFGSLGSGPGQFSFTYPLGLTTDSKGSLWIADTNNSRIQRWLIPNTTVSGYLEPLGASATDTGFGVASLSMKLTDGAGKTEVLGQATQTCSKGACPLSYNLEEFDLSEKPSGPYLLTIEATDAAGNVRRTSRVFSLDSAPPEIVLSGTLAEGAGQPLTTSSAELDISASDADPASGGIKTINVEREGQLVASYPSDCSSDCHKVKASYTFQAKEDGAARSIRPVASSGEGSVGELKRVACLGASNCWAVGRTKYTSAQQAEGKTAAPLLEHWNGQEWLAAVVTKPEGASDVYFEGISCGLTNACLVVGYYTIGSNSYPLAERWDGTKWTISAPPLPSSTTKGSLYGVSCSSASCWARGRTQVSSSEQAEGKVPSSYVVRWKGLSWLTATAALKPAGATDVFLEGVSCNSSSACLVVGYYTIGSNNYPLAERWDGTQWTIQAPPLPSGASKGLLYGISCSSASSCWAYGKTQVTSAEQAEGKVAVPYLVRWDGTTWQTAAVPKTPGGSEPTLAGISCPSGSACTAVGHYTNGYSETPPLVYTWNGSEWRFQAASTPTEATTASLEGIACTSANECVMVGYSRIGSGQWTVLAETEVPGEGPYQITVEAVDAQGNSASNAIEIDVPDVPVKSPECDAEVATVAPKTALNAGQAIEVIKKALPAAVAPSEGMIEEITEEQINPTYSPPSPNLDTIESLAEGETSVTPEGGFTLGEAACFTPTVLTSAASEATVVNGDAAVFANTGPESDTVIRPTAMGATIIQSLRGPEAPHSFSWDVKVAAGDKLIELPSGAIAIVDPGSEESEGTAQIPLKPETSPQELPDVEAQIEEGEYHLISASHETPYEVIAVVAQPWVVLSQGGIVPALIEVVPDTETPNEFEVVVSVPEFDEEEQMEEKAAMLVATASASSSLSGHCPPGESPCGQFDFNRAAKYAKYWGSEEHQGGFNWQHYADFGSNNCTNFVSEILRAGRAKFMHAFVKTDESWWYRNLMENGGVYWNEHEQTDTWIAAELLPRHLWQYGLAHIDPVDQPWGWTTGDILAYDWFGEGGKGNFDHLNFVVGRINPTNGPYEPLIANSSSPGHRYGSKRWTRVLEAIQEAEREDGWTRVPLAVKHTKADRNEKKHAPQNLYGPNGVFQG
jgi:sugar lactone lactonase YvrE